MYAFARGREVGIDVEGIRSGLTEERIAERFFSAAEVEELRALPSGVQAEGFFNCCTRKEAYLKARGTGLQIPLDSFDVTLTPRSGGAIQSRSRALLEPGRVHSGTEPRGGAGVRWPSLQGPILWF